METRASHVLIGTCLLLLAGALFGFVVWLARVDRAAHKPYDIFFRGSVTGLANGAPVRFAGVPIGQVRTIALVPEDPGVVRVRIQINDDVPILRGTRATLEVQGLTGVAFVQLEGGFRGQPEIQLEAGQEVPVIPSRPSAFQSLFENAPQLIEQATVAVNRLGILLNENNRTNVAETLAHINAITGGIARKTPEIERTIDTLNATLAEIKTTAQTVNALAQSAKDPLNHEMPALLHDAHAVVKNADQTLVELRHLLKSGQPGLAHLSETTAPELTRLLMDLRTLTRSLQTTADRLDNKGAAGLLTGEKVPIYDQKSK